MSNLAAVERGTVAMRRGFAQLKGALLLLQGLRFLLLGHQFPLRALRSPYGRLSNCPTVGQSSQVLLGKRNRIPPCSGELFC